MPTCVRARKRTNYLIRNIGQHCNAVVAVSKHTAVTIEELTVRAVRPVVAWDGIDLDRIVASPLLRQESRRVLNISRDALVFVTVARLTTEKDHPTLLRAFACAARHLPVARLLIVGTGPERERLQVLALHLGLQEQVAFCGEIPWPQLNAYLSAADVFVLSTVNEGFGISLVEAATAGLPIIATGLGPITELRDSGLGVWLVKRGDVDSLSQAIAAMSDPGIRNAYAKGNSETARVLFSIERTAGEYLNIYSRLLASPSRTHVLQPAKADLDGTGYE